jgi:hypothetical protein
MAIKGTNINFLVLCGIKDIHCMFAARFDGWTITVARGRETRVN